MLFILIPAIWSSAFFLGLTMCRLAALSDDSTENAVAEMLASQRAQDRLAPPERTDSRRAFDPRLGAYRATG